MNLSAFDQTCAALPHSVLVVQWGGAHVWKIGGKVFAIGWTRTGSGSMACPVTIKVDATASEFLRQEDGVAVAPYFRSNQWLRFEPDCAVEDVDLARYIARSRDIVFRSLTKATQAALP